MLVRYLLELLQDNENHVMSDWGQVVAGSNPVSPTRESVGQSRFSGWRSTRPATPSMARTNRKRTRLAFRSMTTADQASSIPTSRKVLCVVYGVIAVAALIGTWSHIGPYLHSFTDFVGAEIGPCAGARTSTSAHEGAGHAARQTAVGVGAWTPRRSGVGAGDDDRRMTPAAWPMNRRTSRANRPNRPFRADSA